MRRRRGTPRAVGVAAAMAATVALACAAPPAAGQSLLDRSPNLQGRWQLAPGAPHFVFAHRFEMIGAGQDLLNLPTLTLAVGLPGRLAMGLDFSSNSEVVLARTGTNETQYWLAHDLPLGGRAGLVTTAGYNTLARSWDGALTARGSAGRVTLLGELRGFTDLFGRGEAGAAGALGALLHATPYLALNGDAGRVLTDDTVGTVWSAGLAVAIPGSPHTLSVQAGNAGVLTLQGASRPRTRSFSPRRYGFVFTVPLGTRTQWARIFRPGPAGPPLPAAAGDTLVRVEMRLVAFAPAEIRIRPGQRVEWVNRDPVHHTATAEDGSWTSPLLAEGERYSQRFDRPGRYPYYCLPHPMMRGVVIVE